VTHSWFGASAVKFRAAENDEEVAGVEGLDFVGIPIGETAVLEGQTMECTEWANPEEESDFIRSGATAVPTPTPVFGYTGA